MKKEITYIADDGTKFAFEHECIEYEKEYKNKQLTENVLFYDELFKPMNEFDSTSNCNVFNSSYYMIIKNIKAISVVIEAFNEADCYHPFMYCDKKEGLYYYDDAKDSWVYWDDLYNKVNHIKQCLNYTNDKILGGLYNESND